MFTGVRGPTLLSICVLCPSDAPVPSAKHIGFVVLKPGILATTKSRRWTTSFSADSRNWKSCKNEAACFGSQSGTEVFMIKFSTSVDNCFARTDAIDYMERESRGAARLSARFLSRCWHFFITCDRRHSNSGMRPEVSVTPMTHAPPHNCRILD